MSINRGIEKKSRSKLETLDGIICDSLNQESDHDGTLKNSSIFKAIEQQNVQFVPPAQANEILTESNEFVPYMQLKPMGSKKMSNSDDQISPANCNKKGYKRN